MDKLDSKGEEVSIKFGCLYPTLEKQLNEYGFTLGSQANKCERIRDAINRVHLHGIATDEESSRMYKRLMRMMSDYVRLCRGLEATGGRMMTNKEKLIGNSSLDMAGWVFHIFTYCEDCPAHSICSIKDTDEGPYKSNCVKEIARWLDSEVEEK